LFRNVAREELRVPGKVEYLADLRDFVMRVGKKHGFSERVINAFKLSIDEAATNIIKHAYRDWSGDITLRAIAKKSSLTMVLIDQGKFFDPRQVNDPDLQRYVEIGKKGGLGIFIMRRLLDDIDYRKSEEGNELWMVKNLDEARKRKITFTAIPVTLKMRYWLYSLAVFTAVLLIITFYNYLHNRNRIVEDYIAKGRTACSFLGGQVSSNWSVIDPEVINYLKMYGSYDIEVRTGADEGIKTLINSEHIQDIKEVFLTDKRSVILASSDSSRTIWEEKFVIPADAKVFEEFKDSIVYLLEPQSGPPVLNITWPIKGEDGERLADAQLQIDYNKIRREMSQYTLSLISETFFIWLVVSAGLFLLIYVVMNPFKRLQDWVKNLDEPGAADVMDIDASSEIGAIAQAFSDMTIQLRKSQVHLVEQERLQQEMHIAKQIQQTLLPGDFPVLEGYDISSFYAAAKEVGGDFYDFIEVDKDTLGVVVADVSGKGVPGAFVMTMIRTALRSEARGVKDAAEVLAKVNDFVVNDMKRGMFVTLFYVIIDSKRRRINFASAGHNPLILHRPSRNKTYYLNPRGFPIGISLPDSDLFRKSIESDTIALAEDDILLVYTDGVTEAMNAKRKMFGEERFLRIIRECGKKSADDFIETLKKEMNTFTEGNEQNDDITLVAVKEKSSVEKVEYMRAAQVYAMIQKGVGIKEACKEVGISTYSYYQKYKDKFDAEGVENYIVETDLDQVEAKHLAIEEKSKIYDIIRRFPDFGAKRICEELNTEKYEFAQIPVSRIYEELVRLRLNTKQLREAFVQRGGRKKRIKPPGTPMMTVDGRVIMNRAQYDESNEEEQAAVVAKEEAKEKDEIEIVHPPLMQADLEQTAPETDELPGKSIYGLDKTRLLTTPLEDLLDRRSGASKGEDEHNAESSDEIDLWRFDHTTESSSDLLEEMFSDHGENADDQSRQWTVVEKEELDQSEAADAKEQQNFYQSEEQLFNGGSDIEMLANLDPAGEELNPFTFAPEFADDSRSIIADDLSAGENQLKPWEGGETSGENDDDNGRLLLSNEAESFKDNTPAPSQPSEEELFQDDAGPNTFWEDEMLGGEAAETEKTLEKGLFKDLSPSSDGLFELWANDSEGGADQPFVVEHEMLNLFEETTELSDPFEEFLEIQEEQGLITPQGELDVDLHEQFFENEPAFAQGEDGGEDGAEIDLRIKDVPLGSDEVNRRKREDDEFSLDELVSISADAEPLFAQEDQEFDNLLLDAVSDDDKVRGLIKNKSAPQDDFNKANENLLDHEVDEAVHLYQQRRYAEAIKKFQQLTVRFPQDHRLHSLLGNALFREGRYKDAAMEYERVIDLDPLGENARENLATAYANLGDLKKAIHQWESLLKITPKRHDILVRIEKAKLFLEKIHFS
jgi:serine phosphatase RsbU (regulator of sigma subunit)/anti-sigma regulatory factor (Ser/Thr protein kinase)/tetratricopeptide (TPR) repeat protein